MKILLLKFSQENKIETFAYYSSPAKIPKISLNDSAVKTPNFAAKQIYNWCGNFSAL